MVRVAPQSYSVAAGSLGGVQGLVRTCKELVQAGAGVVHDSDPQAEADETRGKAAMLLSVLESAGQAA